MKSSNHLPPAANQVFKGQIFDVYHYDQELFDGTHATYEKLKRPDSCEVIAVTKDKKIILLQEEQPGRKPFMGLPGGRVDAGEDPLTTAKREFLEETGYEGEDWELCYTSSPSEKIIWDVHVFIARGVEKVREPKVDPGEKAQVQVHTFDEFMNAIEREDFRDKDVALHLMRLKSHPEKLSAFRQRLTG